MIEAFENLLTGRRGREEVEKWSADFSRSQISKDIYWDSQIAKVIALKFTNDNNCKDYFIRETDIQDYLFGLKFIDPDLVDTICQPIRRHQLTERLGKPCVFLKVVDASALERLGIKPVRSIYDIPYLMEHSFFKFDDMEMAIMRSLDPDDTYGMAEIVLPEKVNTQSAEEKLVKFLSLLSLEPESVWVAQEFNHPVYLKRLDDNGHEFIVRRCESLLEAYVYRNHFEKKERKNLYFLDSTRTKIKEDQPLKTLLD